MIKSRFVLDTNAVISLTKRNNTIPPEREKELNDADLFVSVITEIELFSKPGLPSDEETDALDELVTKNPPKVSGNGKNGFFMKHKGNIVILDDVSATWLHVTAESSDKSPEEIIGEMIREKIALAS